MPSDAGPSDAGPSEAGRSNTGRSNAGPNDAGRTAGYSGTPLARKLGIKEGSTLVLIDAEPGVISGFPPGVDVRNRAGRTADVVVFFVTRAAKLERRIATLEKAIFPAGALWVAFPKRASGVETDVTDHVIRDIALPRGLVDNKVCAIDEKWTGLRLVWRVQRRTVN